MTTLSPGTDKMTEDIRRQVKLFEINFASLL